MNSLFLGVCGVSFIFFAVFLLGCQRDLRKRRPKGTCVTRVSPDVEAIDSVVGRRYLIHLEQQMAEFTVNHQRTVS